MLYFQPFPALSNLLRKHHKIALVGPLRVALFGANPTKCTPPTRPVMQLCSPKPPWPALEGDGPWVLGVTHCALYKTYKNHRICPSECGCQTWGGGQPVSKFGADMCRLIENCDGGQWIEKEMSELESIMIGSGASSAAQKGKPNDKQALLAGSTTIKLLD